MRHQDYSTDDKRTPNHVLNGYILTEQEMCKEEYDDHRNAFAIERKAQRHLFQHDLPKNGINAKHSNCKSEKQQILNGKDLKI